MKNDVTGERLTFGQSSFRNQADHVARYQFASEFIKGKRVLDIACGTGYGSAQLADRGAAKVVGIDIDQNSIMAASNNYSRANISYEVGSAAKISYPNAYFDVIVTFETIEHLEDSDRFEYLKELKRVVKADGLIVLSTPNKRITSPWSVKPLNKFHVLEFTKHTLAAEIEAAGMSVSEWYGQRYVLNMFTYRLPYLCIRLIEKISRRSLHIYNEADGSKVRQFRKWYQPRYFVLKIKP